MAVSNLPGPVQFSMCALFLRALERTGDYMPGRFFQVSPIGRTFDVPVSGDVFNNPPRVGDFIWVTGMIVTSGARLDLVNVGWFPVSEDKPVPDAEHLSTFQGQFKVETSSYLNKSSGDVRYRVTLFAPGFLYNFSTEREDFEVYEKLSRSGFIPLSGSLATSEIWNKDRNLMVPMWTLDPHTPRLKTRVPAGDQK